MKFTTILAVSAVALVVVSPSCNAQSAATTGIADLASCAAKVGGALLGDANLQQCLANTPLLNFDPSAILNPANALAGLGAAFQSIQLFTPRTIEAVCKPGCLDAVGSVARGIANACPVGNTTSATDEFISKLLNPNFVKATVCSTDGKGSYCLVQTIELFQPYVPLIASSNVVGLGAALLRDATKIQQIGCSDCVVNLLRAIDIKKLVDEAAKPLGNTVGGALKAALNAYTGICRFNSTRLDPIILPSPSPIPSASPSASPSSSAPTSGLTNGFKSSATVAAAAAPVAVIAMIAGSLAIIQI